jgi:hypothetical protein
MNTESEITVDHPLNTPEAADQARSALVVTERDAQRGDVPRRDVWVVVTSSYRLDVDPATPEGRRRAEAVVVGRLDAALAGVEASSTVVGVRTALDGKAPD